jgi:uncharacterized protein (DUF58 family)
MPENTSIPDYMKQLPQEAVGSVSRLDFLARGFVEGFKNGHHRSPHKGFSVEFAEHRPYVPGDDIRGLDWRVYARTDRYFIKEYMEETNLRATILLDASGSMRYQGEAASVVDGKTVSKYDFARYMAATLTYLLIHQQDAVGLVTFDTAVREFLPARAQPSQIRRILASLHETEPGGETNLAPILHEIADRIPRRGVVIIISDLFDNAADIVKAFHHFDYARHELIVFHIMAEEELTFPFESFTEFHDLEGVEETLQIDPKTIRSKYLDRVRLFMQEMEQSCGRMKADYVPISTKEDFNTALADYLSKRRLPR